MLGADPSPDDNARSPHVDIVFARPALLGQAKAHSGSAPRRLVGCEQNWAVAATHRDLPRLAGLLPRSTAHAFRLSVSIGLGPLRYRESGKMPAPRGSVDLWAGGLLRASR